MTEHKYDLPEKVLNKYYVDDEGVPSVPDTDVIGFAGIPEYVYVCPKCELPPIVYETSQEQFLLCPSCQSGVKTKCKSSIAFVFNHYAFERWNQLVERCCENGEGSDSCKC